MMGNFTHSKTYKDKGGRLWKITTIEKSTGNITQIMESLEPEGTSLIPFMVGLAKELMKQFDGYGLKVYYVEATETKLTVKARELGGFP